MPVSTRSRKPGTRAGRARFVAVAAAVLAAAALTLAPAAGASAHDYLIASTPKANSTQTTPLKKVTLTFDDIVLDLSHNGSSALLQVTGPDGASRHFETGCPTISGRDVSAPVALGGPGKYLVTWQIVSADGHTVSDSISFTYQPPAGQAAAKGSAGRPSCGRESSGSNTASATPGANTQPDRSQSAPSSLGIVITIAAIIVGLAVAGVIIIVLTSRRTPKPRKPRAAPDDD